MSIIQDGLPSLSLNVVFDFVSAACPTLIKLPREPRRGVVPDARSGSIKLNIIATKIGSIVLLIVTKIILS